VCVAVSERRRKRMRIGYGSRAIGVIAPLVVAGALMGGGGAVWAEEAPAPGEKDTLGTPQEEEPSGPNRGRVSFSIGSDVTNAYFFRGILQERHGFIWQPSGLMGLNLFSDEDGFITSLDGTFGLWASVQTEKTLASGSGPSNFYELDVYPGMSVSTSLGLSTSLTYVTYTSPNGGFSTIQELDWGLAYDDSELLGDVALYPAATFAFELDNSALGSREGGYFQLSLAPSHTFDPYPVTLSFPLNLGLSLYDYFQVSGGGPNNTFGFFTFGINMGFPLEFIPEEYGSLTMKFGANIYVLSNTLESLNEGDEMWPVGVWTLAYAY
jgi:hypothetical protein